MTKPEMKCNHKNCEEVRKEISRYSDQMIQIIARTRGLGRTYMHVSGKMIEPTFVIALKCIECKANMIQLTMIPLASIDEIFSLMESGAVGQFVNRNCTKCSSTVLTCIGWTLDHVDRVIDTGIEHVAKGDHVYFTIIYEYKKQPTILYTGVTKRGINI